MKSPADLSARLARQWHRSSLRVERLLSEDAWPLELSIGKPSGSQFLNEIAAVQKHVRCWKSVSTGEVIWEPVKFRASAEPVNLPVQWRIKTPSEWVTASSDKTVEDEFRTLEYIVKNVNQIYREIFIRNRSLWRNKDLDQVVATATLADSLFPGAAKGRPLRLMAGHGVDTKFIERNESLLTRLLDERYQGEASEQGVFAFLDAFDENEHWVLVAPLDPKVLPFRRQRVTTKELSESVLPANNILIVENEQCVHNLPNLSNTIAVLGAGLDLLWLKSDTFSDKTIGYWGDMDTWGLLMLARARQYASKITPLLMNQNLFERYSRANAVSETTTAGSEPPDGLTGSEAAFYLYLLNQTHGRLEQEYLPAYEVQSALKEWVN